MPARLTGLWRHPDFMRLWVGQTISKFGSAITGAAIAVTAVLILQATPVQMGLLAAAGAAPVLLVSPLAGVWVDRLRRRPILIATDLLRALLLLLIPLAWKLDVLRMEQLYVVTALTGVLTVFFDVAYQSFLPALVERDQLVEGNSKLGMSDSVSEVSGPPFGWALVQVISAPLAILLDALSFVVSALAVALIRTPEPPPALPDQRQSIGRDIGEGLRVVLGNRLLRSLLGSVVTLNLFGGMIGAMYDLFVLRDLDLPPVVVGILTGIGGVSALTGAFIAERVARRFGIGPALIGGLALATGAQLLIPLARGPLAVPFMVAAQLGDIGWSIFFINELSLRQTITPGQMLGRANATTQFMTGGALPLGALVAGWLAQTIGVRTTLALGTLGLAFAWLWVLFSPVRGLRELPGVVEPVVGT